MRRVCLDERQGGMGRVNSTEEYSPSKVSLGWAWGVRGSRYWCPHFFLLLAFFPCDSFCLSICLSTSFSLFLLLSRSRKAHILKMDCGEKKEKNDYCRLYSPFPPFFPSLCPLRILTVISYHPSSPTNVFPFSFLMPSIFLFFFGSLPCAIFFPWKLNIIIVMCWAVFRK